MLWENLTDEEQVRLYCEYCAYDKKPISFQEFDEMMRGFVVYTSQNVKEE